MSSIRLAGVVAESIVDGPGIRFTVFTQGCPHGCPGCHNPDTHDSCGGYEENTATLLAKYKKNPLLRGITLSGGEPFEQALPCAALAAEVRRLGGDVVVYTGYTFEQLLSHADSVNGWQALLAQTDVLVDGPFVLEEKTLMLPFRGSSNQRAIDVPASLQEGKTVEAPWPSHK